MSKEKGGAIAAAGVIAIGGGHYVASGGHLLPAALRDAKGASRIHTAPSGREFEVPEWVEKSGEEAVKHCLKELDAGEECIPPY